MGQHGGDGGMIQGRLGSRSRWYGRRCIFCRRVRTGREQQNQGRKGCPAWPQAVSRKDATANSHQVIHELRVPRWQRLRTNKQASLREIMTCYPLRTETAEARDRLWWSPS